MCETLQTLNKLPQKYNPFEEMTKSMQSLFSALSKCLAKQAESFETEVRQAARESILVNGKMIRPILVFAAANNLDCDVSSLVRRAAIVEMTHLSTLIHDDVIDNASVRRNVATPNKKYGARTAILLGDAIFANTMSLTFEDNDRDMSKKTADCVRTICEGEISQTLADKKQNVSREKYYDIAYGKTAVLFSLACALGAMCVKKTGGWVEAAEEVGRELGIAYQIYDDICDWFMSESDIGKTLGTDLLSGKQTYPLIILLERLPSDEAQKLANNLPTSNPEYIVKRMRELNVAQECEKEFLKRIERAEKILSDFPRESGLLLRFCQAMRELKLA